MNELTLDIVVHRLSRLEKQVRWWKGVGLLAMILLGLVVLMGATKGKDAGVAEEIRARRFVVVDSVGKPRAELLVGIDTFQRSESPRLTLYGKANDKAELSVSLFGPSLDLGAV